MFNSETVSFKYSTLSPHQQYQQQQQQQQQLQ
jgi:hypothetical protein